MSSSSSIPKTTTPFTPKRPLSVQSNNNSLLASTHKRYKSTISVESKPRGVATPKPKGELTHLVTPLKNETAFRPKSRLAERPKTPSTPKLDEDNDKWMERDVSKVDVEGALVDASCIDVGDVSAEVDETSLRSISGNAEIQADDKVLVSVRLRPSNAQPAWSTTSSAIKLDASLTRNTGSSSNSTSSFEFDSIFTSQTNKHIYTTVALPHVHSAMSGFNAVVFAYGQTASGKTHTLSGTPEDPGIIPRAMKDVFAFIRRNDEREYLLRCSYLEIYNENIIDLLATPATAASNPVQIQGTGDKITLAPLREEVVTSFKGVKEVLKRGEGNRRTACTDWNDRSSRSHSVFRLVIESRERGGMGSTSGRTTPGLSGRMTPGGSRLQAKGDKSVQTSVLSLIDLAGSEKATSDKDRTREGKYINTSLLTLGTVIGTLSENAAKNKTDHVPYRNSKLTRMLQPSLSGDARISVICTINPDGGAITESTSTLLFARRIKGVAIHAKKKEIVDTDALIERYRKEIEDLKTRLAERETADAPQAAGKRRRLSVQEQIDETKAMRDLNARIQQLTKLILTSQTVSEETGSLSRPSSPVKVDFDMEPYQLQQELLAARYQLESQANQILSLEAALIGQQPGVAESESSSSDLFSPSQSSSSLLAEKDALIAEQAKKIKELESGSAMHELQKQLDEETKKREEKERWSKELERALDKEKKSRAQLEEERRALASFVSMFDSLGLGGLSAPSSPAASPAPAAPPTTSEGNRFPKTKLSLSIQEEDDEAEPSPRAKPPTLVLPTILEPQAVPLPRSPTSPTRSILDTETGPSLLDEEWGYVDHGDISFEAESLSAASKRPFGKKPIVEKFAAGMKRRVLGGGSSKENLPLA